MESGGCGTLPPYSHCTSSLASRAKEMKLRMVEGDGGRQGGGVRGSSRWADLIFGHSPPQYLISSSSSQRKEFAPPASVLIDHESLPERHRATAGM